jgi:WD40 repeat protein
VIPAQPPSFATFLIAPDDVLLAVGYRGHPVLVWNSLDLRLLGCCDTDVINNGINDMIFNPNTEIAALVVSYNDGRLCVFSYITMELQSTWTSIFAETMACSPDGRSLVIGSSRGTVEVYEFDRDRDGRTSLTLIYTTSHVFGDSVRGVAFSFNGLRFVDVRGQQCRVWAPAVLVRNNDELDSLTESTSDDVSLPPSPKTRGMLVGPSDPEITSPLVVSMDGRYVITGKSDGAVVVFSTMDSHEICVLYRHAKSASIICIALSNSGQLVVSADDSGRVLAAELLVPFTTASAEFLKLPSVAKIVLDRRFGAAAVNLLISSANDRLLISGRHIDELWELPSGRVVASRRSPLTAPELQLSSPAFKSEASVSSSLDGDSAATLSTLGAHSFFEHPVNRDWLVAVSGDVAHVHAWANLTEITSPEGIPLERPPQPAAHSSRVVQDDASTPTPPPSPKSNHSWATSSASYHTGPGFVIEHLQRSSPSVSPRIIVWPAAAFDPSSSVGMQGMPATEPNLEVISPAVQSVLGIVGTSTLVFLDINLWVCSTELQCFSTSTTPLRNGKVGGGARFLPSQLHLHSETIHAQRHFFALSEWRNSSGELRCALASVKSTAARMQCITGSQDVVFASGHRLIVVKGGLEFSESVSASEIVPWGGHSDGTSHAVSGGRALGGHYDWKIISGSMHRRTTNW